MLVTIHVLSGALVGAVTRRPFGILFLFSRTDGGGSTSATAVDTLLALASKR